MPIYQVTPLASNAEKVGAAVEGKFQKGSFYRLPGESGWFITYPGTSVELSNDLGITGQQEGEKSTVGPTLVCSIGAYYGRGPMEMWEWMQTRLEAK